MSTNHYESQWSFPKETLRQLLLGHSDLGTPSTFTYQPTYRRQDFQTHRFENPGRFNVPALCFDMTLLRGFMSGHSRTESIALLLCHCDRKVKCELKN